MNVTRPLAVFLLALAPMGAARSGPATPAEPGAPGPHVGTPMPAPVMVPPEVEAAMNAGPTGQIAVRAVQGTKGGPAIGEAAVEVELYHRNRPVKRIQSVLDEHGVVLIRDVPLGLSVRPVVKVRYGAATYQDAGPQMDATHTSASVDVTVYEMTDEAPAWKITGRTLAIAPIPGELDVVETMEVENPADRTWMGAPADERGRRATVSVNLPKGARDVGLEFGFHGWCCTTVAEDRLIVQMPLMPGKAPFRFTYRIDAPSGTSDVSVSAPAACDLVEFLIPDNQFGTQPSGLKDAGTRTVGNTLVRVYQAGPVAAGAPLALSLSGLPRPMPMASAAPVGAAAPSEFESNLPLYVALSVGVAILGGAIYMYLRPPAGRPRKPARPNTPTL